MKGLRRIIRYLLFAVIVIISFVFLYFIAAFILSNIPVNSKQTQTGDIPIYVITNGVHSDIVLPVKTDILDWSKSLPYSDTEGADSTCYLVSFGWGNRAFYLETPTWGDLKLSTAFKAVTGIGATAMHVTYYKNIKVGETSRKILITHQQYQVLVSFINSSFNSNTEGKFKNIKTKANYGKLDAFYEAKGHYSLFYTCNTWTNQALKNCKQKACLWTPFDKGIFRLYKN